MPAANYLQLPQDRTEGLGLTGGFLYLQIVSCNTITQSSLLLNALDAVQNRKQILGLCSRHSVWAMQLRGPVLRDLSAWVQILVQPADTYSIHVDVKTTDRNTTCVSISNLFNPEALKVAFLQRT